MNHRPRYRRAFSSISVILIVALSVVTSWFIGFRNNAEWHGVALGASQEQVLERLGEPGETFVTASISWVSYRDVDVWFRDGEAFCIKVRGRAEELYREACLRYGAPIYAERGNVDWAAGSIIARLYENELTVSRD